MTYKLNDKYRLASASLQTNIQTICIPQLTIIIAIKMHLIQSDIKQKQ